MATIIGLFAKTHPDVLLEQGLLSAGVRKARKLAQEGVEIMISRGGTAAAIKEAQLGLDKQALNQFGSWRESGVPTG
ncbi:MAG: PrpR N-terminal domain-containing protein [Proteobacteria bacterium]|nr:PrpR N-terminal domain-containing protein [Pseudomonadota bacterium]MBU2228254.1 PrpR N-terminal domain-containing protein [Pseudomonadota bacterium]MBU2262267.1 PrpR N-terminal domain-containing protein [Pseudomonadota bacterium]